MISVANPCCIADWWITLYPSRGSFKAPVRNSFGWRSPNAAVGVAEGIATDYTS